MLTVDTVDDMQRSYGEITAQMAILDTLVIRLSRSDTDIAVLSLHQSGQLFRNTAHIIARLRKDILENSASVEALADLNRFRGYLEAQAAVMASAANELSDHLSRDYREKILELAATSRKNQRLVMALGAGSLFLAWLVSRYFLGGHVVERLRLVSRYLRSGDANGGEIPVRGHDEISEMARAVKQFLEDRRQLAEAQLSLRQSEEMLRAITDAVQSAVFLIDDEDRIQFVNPAAEAMFGYSREEILGRRLHETIVPERFREQAGEGLSAYRITGEGAIFAHPRELAGRRKDGTELDILLLVGRVFKNGRWWAAGSIIDITERLAAEVELKKTQNEAMHAARLASIGQLAAGEIVIATQAAEDEVVITISDTGGGVPEEIWDQIFHPFFTTKPVGKGSGQGLAICYDIVVNKHQGRIEVGGVPGEGAVFTVHLPVK